jgi:hypothetical protein
MVVIDMEEEGQSKGRRSAMHEKGTGMVREIMQHKYTVCIDIAIWIQHTHYLHAVCSLLVQGMCS